MRKQESVNAYRRQMVLWQNGIICAGVKFRRSGFDSLGHHEQISADYANVMTSGKMKQIMGKKILANGAFFKNSANDLPGNPAMGWY